MNIKEKIKYLVAGILIAGVVWFFYTTYRQIQINRANIQAIGDFLNRASQSQTVPAQKTPVKNETKEKGDGGEQR